MKKNILYFSFAVLFAISVYGCVSYGDGGRYFLTVTDDTTKEPVQGILCELIRLDEDDGLIDTRITNTEGKVALKLYVYENLDNTEEVTPDFCKEKFKIKISDIDGSQNGTFETKELSNVSCNEEITVSLITK